MKSEVMTPLNLAHFFRRIIIASQLHSQHTDASLPSWHELINSIITAIRPMNSQPFTHSHFLFPLFSESVTCQMLLQWSELHYSILLFNSEIIHMPHQLSTAYFHHDRIFKLMPRCKKCVSVLRDYILQMRILGPINEPHVIL